MEGVSVSDRDNSHACVVIYVFCYRPPPLLTFFLPVFAPLVDVHLEIDAGPAGQTLF